MRSWPLLAILSACGSGASGPISSADLAFLALSEGELWPPFASEDRSYAVAASELDEPGVIAIAADPRATVVVRHETVDGALLVVGGSGDRFPLRGRERIAVVVTSHDGKARRTYRVTATPDALPVIEAEALGAGPSEGFYLLAPIDYTRPPPFFLLAVDTRGVPVWYRRMDDFTHDLEVGAHGGITYVTGTAEAARAEVLDPSGAVVESYRPLLPLGWDWVFTDAHEFTALADGTRLVLGRGDRRLDLSELGGDEQHAVFDNTLQHVDSDGTVLFHWTSFEGFGLDDVPAAFLPPTPGEREEFVHVNSVQVDPEDGNYVIGARVPSQILKLARHETSWRGATYAPGDVMWRLGGPTTGDLAFVDDDRLLGWKGFAGQHHGNPLPGDRILVYDNATNWDLGAVGESRAVEYQLDFDAGTASLLAEFPLPDSTSTTCCGGVQRTSDGHTVVCWGDLPFDQAGTPLATEFDAAGAPVLELREASGLWSYRVSKVATLPGL